jgi:sugar/nucleoside kinase (ribokinase family)
MGVDGWPTTGPVVVLGDVMTDVVADGGEPLGPDAARPTTGLTTRQGGAGANVAHWLAALHVPTAFVGCVGQDPFGVEATAVLQVAGVDLHVEHHPHLPTGSRVVLPGADGKPEVMPDAGANSALSPALLPVDLVRSASWLHVCGNAVLNPGSRDAALLALQVAREGSVPTSVDAAGPAPLEAVGHRRFLELTDDVHVLFCTLDEAEVLCDSRDPSVVAARLTATYPQLVLTLGTQGAWWASGAGDRRVGAPASDAPVTDADGSRDAFTAAYLARVARGRRAGPSPAWLPVDVVEQALTEGCALAARVRTRRGSRPF